MYRDRRTLLILVPVVAFFLVVTSLYLSSDYLTRVVLPKLHYPSAESIHELPTPGVVSSDVPVPDNAASSTSNPTPTPLVAIEPVPIIAVGNGTILKATLIQQYVDAILDPELTTFKRLQCPPINETRYAPLRSPGEPDTDEAGLSFFFALNLRNNLPILPRLIGSIVEAIRFLGPDRCAISIVEGNSPDGTGDVLKALGPFLDRLGIQYHYSTSEINPKEGDRIEKLAQLRNMALHPLIEAFEDSASADTTVVFLNDVAACSEDILELALQRRRLGADMTCAMDWTYAGADPTFYDVWISRGINGDSFFYIPETGSWEHAWNLFWNDSMTKSRYVANMPFQVFSCWNGAVTFSAAPLLDGVRFRDAQEGHCKHGEPQIFCKDLWSKGYGKIAVVPTVNLEYSDDKGMMIKTLKGYVMDLVRDERANDSVIDWSGPPEEVKCIENWGNQFWKPWEVSRRDLQDSSK
ncbi:hypothetical protein NLU13_4634 [Sarocladium strictum]|uniref:Alpha-1,3-mannosyltransferase CMT1 n=1 Tax=Sarocladium strictum TaxID=5046 RepID=A0AA39GKY5_SARSR|nr:hypothetical protein NLU13_4634 [Sarocladium strictum]